MIILLEKESKSALRRFDYNRAKDYIEQTLLLNHWIVNSGFLSIQDDEFRKATKDRLRGTISDLEDLLEVIEIVRSGLIEKFLMNLSSTSPSKSNKRNLLFERLSKLLEIIPGEMVDSVLLEDSVRPIINDGFLFSGVYPYNRLLTSFHERKKALRKKLFHGRTISLTESFHDTDNWNHYLFFLDMEYQCSTYLRDDPTASIDKATLMTAQAMSAENIELKTKQFKDTINFLDLQKFLASSFNSNSDHIEWSHAKNIILARCYEYLANIEPSISEKLSLLKFSENHYKRGTDKKRYIVSLYHDYYEFLHKFESKDIISTIKKDTQALLLLVDKSFYLNQKHPVLIYFHKFYTILSLMGQDDLESIKILTDYIEPQVNKQSDFPEIAMLARQVLANNAIIPITQDEYSYYKSIKKYLITKELSAPIYEETVVDPTDIENHKIFDEENQLFEIKGSFFIDVNRLLFTKQSDEDILMKEEVYKTIAGMLNADGGELIIGVLEADRYDYKKLGESFNEIEAVRIGNRIIIGIEPDLNHLKINPDSYILKISDQLRHHICDNIGSFIQIRTEKVEGRTILRISIEPYPEEGGVAVDKIKFYIRENNQTMSYEPLEFFKIRQTKSKQINLSLE